LERGASDPVELRLIAVALPDDAIVEEFESLRVRVLKGRRILNT